MTEMTAGEKLLALRATLDLTQLQVAEITSLSQRTIGAFEHNSEASFTEDTRQKISAFIEKHAHEIPDDYQDWISHAVQKAKKVQKAKEDETLREQMIRTFIGGKRYSIFDSEKGGNSVHDINPITGKGCIFIYLRKEGKHHMFREETGGWTRTYTDVQLMGKKIREVVSS